MCTIEILEPEDLDEHHPLGSYSCRTLRFSLRILKCMAPSQHVIQSNFRDGMVYGIADKFIHLKV